MCEPRKLGCVSSTGGELLDYDLDGIMRSKEEIYIPADSIYLLMNNCRLSGIRANKFGA